MSRCKGELIAEHRMISQRSPRSKCSVRTIPVYSIPIVWDNISIIKGVNLHSLFPPMVNVTYINEQGGRGISPGTSHAHNPVTITDEMLSLLFCHVSCSIPKHFRAHHAHACYSILNVDYLQTPGLQTHLNSGGGEDVVDQCSLFLCQALRCWAGGEAPSLLLHLPTLQQSVALTVYN